ncbi:MAG: hypothetical protein J0H34_08910 [Rhizobiales bacterium]|nr:hypothetical protein [Hyphomicrobiales bacterium]
MPNYEHDNLFFHPALANAPSAHAKSVSCKRTAAASTSRDAPGDILPALAASSRSSRIRAGRLRSAAWRSRRTPTIRDGAAGKAPWRRSPAFSAKVGPCTLGAAGEAPNPAPALDPAFLWRLSFIMFLAAAAAADPISCRDRTWGAPGLWRELGEGSDASYTTALIERVLRKHHKSRTALLRMPFPMLQASYSGRCVPAATK